MTHHQTIPLPSIAVIILLLLLSTSTIVQKVSAFAVPSAGGHFSVSAPVSDAAVLPKTKFALNNKKKNFADEILDALDTMAGVSPLTETDLKQQQQQQQGINNKSKNANDEILQQEWLLARQAQREQVAPPKDALQKTSVSIFFALLGVIPSLLLLYAASFGGIKPFGL
jgi:hypothetical protein